MLEIKNITKDYDTGTDEKVRALRGVSVNFRDCELVAILGHSGCGKTTLLNIIGGLDQYTSGDLIINGRSTKQYKSRDWDTYRNHSVGFIFQSYNLIPHQTVLANVELALTLSGVSKAERRRRAVEALVKVGLGDQLNKRPNQMSGGQMQRVAIARACLHPYMWVCKSHYYGPTFYNFPYAFGGLFARGLYARYQAEGASFVPKYKKLLYTTTVATAEDTAKVAGIDLTDKDFWRDALQTIADQIDLFCQLV